MTTEVISTSPKIPLAKLMDDSYFEGSNLGNYDGLIVELKLPSIVTCEPVNAKDLTGSFLNFEAYPVPGEDYVFVETEQGFNDTSLDFVISNVLGQVVFKKRVKQFSPGSPVMLDISHLAVGNYFLTIISAGKFGTAKIVKH